MSAKKHPVKKSARQKKILSAVTISHEGLSSPNTNEDAIVRQFHRIQRGYLLLMNEVAKEFDLVKGWLEKEASQRRNIIKARLSRKLPRMN